MRLTLAEASTDLFSRFGTDEAKRDRDEAWDLQRYLHQVSFQGVPVVERSLYTFLFLLRASLPGFPAPDSVAAFSRTHFSSADEAFQGENEDAEVWDSLEHLWQVYNQGSVCPRTSDLRWQIIVAQQRKAATPSPRFRFEDHESEEERVEACGWGCGGLCGAECKLKTNGRWVPGYLGPEYGNPESVDCSCANSGGVCNNIFDLVDRLIEEEHFLSLPLEQLGQNLRKALPASQQSIIDDAYSQARLMPKPDYRSLEDPPSVSLRVRDARLLINGVKTSKFLFNLLLSSPPTRAMPLYFSLGVSTIHARLWLNRANLPIYLREPKLTYAVVCTNMEPEIACELFSEQRPSRLEFCLQTETWGYFWGTWFMGLSTGIRVLCASTNRNEVPERLLRSAPEHIWDQLLRLPIPTLVSDKSGMVRDTGIHPPGPVSELLHCYLLEMDVDEEVVKRLIDVDRELARERLQVQVQVQPRVAAPAGRTSSSKGSPKFVVVPSSELFEKEAEGYVKH